MSPLVYQWINIIVLFSVLGLVLRKKLGAYFTSQRTELDQKIKSAGEEYARIKSEYDQMQKSADSIEAKIKELETVTTREVESEIKRIETEAKRGIEKISQDSEARIRNESERMRKSLEKELFDSAIQLSKAALQQDEKSQSEDWISQVVQPEQTDGRKTYAS